MNVRVRLTEFRLLVWIALPEKDSTTESHKPPERNPRNDCSLELGAVQLGLRVGAEADCTSKSFGHCFGVSLDRDGE